MNRYLTVLFAFLITMFSTATPAAAADELGISSDGVNYTPTFQGPLFSSAINWVPGDSRTATFYVRNQNSDQADLAITVLGDHIGDLLDSGDVTITATGAGGVSTPVSDGGEHSLLIASEIMGGQVVPVDVTVDFDEDSLNGTQLRSTDLRFRVTLTQSGAVSPGHGGDDDADGGLLPDTGAPQLIWIVALGAILLGTGVAIVSRRRETQQGESHV